MTQFVNPPSTFAGWTPLPSSPGAGPSSTALPPIASATTNSTQQHRIKRRPPAAYEILSDFYYNVTDRPSKRERFELAEKVRRIPGCEDYKPADVSGYFSRKRQSEARASDESRHQPDSTTPQPSAASAKILYPSLTRGPKSIQRLEVLLRDDPDPSEEIAAIWAERIGYQAKAKDILTYAKLCRVRKPHSPPPPPSTFSTMPPLPSLPPFSAQRTQTSHLPTPSTSPEPGSLPTSPVVANHGIIGRITATVSVKEEVDELESDEDMELDSDTDSEVEVPLSATVAHTPPVLPSRVQHDLVTSLQKVFSQPRPPPGNDATTPRSFAQLSRWIGGQDQATTALLDGISKGRYAHLGLKPVASSAAPPRP